MHEIEAFAADHAERHPELRRLIRRPDVRTIARREGVGIRRLPLTHPGRRVRFGVRREFGVSDELDVRTRAHVGVHEFVHEGRDRLAEPAIDMAGEHREHDPKEDSANAVAGYLMSPHRPNARGERG